MSISTRLNEFRKGTPPTQIHARKLAKLKNKVFSAYGKLDARDAAKLGSFSRKLIAIEEKMGKKGVLFSFSWEKEAITTADIFHRAQIEGCPVIFLANSEISTNPRGAGDPNVTIIPAHYSCIFNPCENSIKRERIAIFADLAESLLESNSIIMGGAIEGLGDAAHTIPAETLMPLLGRHYGGPSAQGVPPSLLAEAYSALSNFFSFGEKLSLEDVLVGYIAHELGHMAFTRRFPQWTLDSPAQERFAFSYVLANSRFPHVDFANIIKMAVPSQDGSSLHKSASAELVAGCNSRLFGEDARDSPIEALIPRYLQAPADRILSAAIEVFGAVCKSLGASKEDFMGNPFERAKKAVFG